MKLATDCDPREAFLRVWSDSHWSRSVKDEKSQSSLKVAVDGCLLYLNLHRANRGHERTQVVKLSTTLQRWPRVPNSCSTVQQHVARDDAKVSSRTTLVSDSSLATTVGETRSGHLLEHVHPLRAAQTFSDEVTTLPQTATAEALERPNVGQK